MQVIAEIMVLIVLIFLVPCLILLVISFGIRKLKVSRTAKIILFSLLSTAILAPMFIAPPTFPLLVVPGVLLWFYMGLEFSLISLTITFFLSYLIGLKVFASGKGTSG